MKSKKHEKGLLFVISGASGTGKTTLCHFLQENFNLFFSISMTTRSPRPNEVEGRDYLFVSEKKFKDLISENAFFEYAQVHNNYYGTPKQAILQSLGEGKNVLLDIDVQGALQVKKSLPEAILIFLMAPSIEELRKRLESRATDSQDIIEKRIQKANDEIAMKSNYDYVVINQKLEAAKKELASIVLQEINKNKK